ncbi:MAG: DUF3168 domain-containing protein [Patescibacteria group bacterium]|jgi:hypothetical protein
MDALLTAIFSKLSGSNFSNDVGGRIFVDQAPANAEFPYAVINIVSDVPENVFAKLGESVMVQFSLFSTSTSLVEITGMFNDLKALFDDCSLTITGYTLSWCRRSNLTTMAEDITTPEGTSLCRHWAVDYEIDIEAS